MRGGVISEQSEDLSFQVSPPLFQRPHHSQEFQFRGRVVLLSCIQIVTDKSKDSALL